MAPFVAQTRGQEGVAVAPYFQVRGGGGAVDTLPLKAMDVQTSIAGPLAEVEITQTYVNIGDVTLEAVYVFPGSTRAAVHGLEMRIGDRVTRAQIKRKGEARQTYETAKSEGRTASLLEQHRPNVFQMNLANIRPGDFVEVTLRYTEWLTLEDGEYTFVLPTAYGQRGDAFAATDAASAGSGANAVDFAFAGRVAAGVPLASVECRTHEMQVERPDPSLAEVRYIGDPNTAGDRDLVLSFRVSSSATQSGLLLSEGNGEKYFMALLQPPVREAERPRIPREYFFVVDVSGSMSGFPLDTAKLVMTELVSLLEPTDRFNLLLFAGSAEVFAAESVPATEANLVKAIVFLQTANGGGSTQLLPALRRVYATPKPPATSRSIVVLTDGYVSVEREAFDLIRERLDEANLFAIGIGSAVNRFLIDGMAKVGKGEPMYALDPRDAAEVASKFAGYVSEPVLTDIRVAYEGFDAYEVEPPALPDLLAQRPVVVFGKWRGSATGSIRISGRSGASDYASVIEVSNGADLADSRVLEYVWARERIQRLDDYNRLWQDGEREEEVTRLGLKHSLLTAYTSFVAVSEVRPVAGDSVRVQQSTPAPKGVDMRGAQGLSVPTTPEPGLWAMMLATIAGLAYVARRRKRTATGA